LDITKVKTVLGWLPVYTFEQAAAQTALWYKAFYDGADIKEFTLKQIKEYQDNIKWNTF
jgi:CDP-glucose 4,6-dehydratase